MKCKYCKNIFTCRVNSLSLLYNTKHIEPNTVACITKHAFWRSIWAEGRVGIPIIPLHLNKLILCVWSKHGEL